VEWFLSNRGGSVRGYSRAIYSGFTTAALARITGEVIERHPKLSGVYQVSSEPINKYDLLCLLRDRFGVSVKVESSADVQIDRSLNGDRFRTTTGFAPPTWPAMIQELANDPTPYEQWRNDRGSRR
ncbi:MAG TPA: hypothetical protein VGJ87_09710, partial [Roseiflexaceae bacterium]